MLAAAQPLQLLFERGDKLQLSSIVARVGIARIPGKGIARLSRRGSDATRAGEEQNGRQSAGSSANANNAHLTRKPFENEAGRILVYIWNIPEKMNKHEFTFLMSRIPGVECWEYIQKGYRKSAGYAYCECPIMEDAEETISLLRRFTAHGQKLSAALYNPDKIGIGKDSTAAAGSSLGSGKMRGNRKAVWSHSNNTDNRSGWRWRSDRMDGFRRRKKQQVMEKKVIPKRPPSPRLTLGYSPRYSAQHWDRVKWTRAAGSREGAGNQESSSPAFLPSTD